MTCVEIPLTEEQVEVLERLARDRQISVPELIQEEVATLLRTAEATSRPPATLLAEERERRRRAIAAAGRFRSSCRDLSTRHDDYFAEACEE